MLKLDVNLTFPDGRTIFCGELFTTNPSARGKIEGSFRYTINYLEHPKAFALDPEHLPLGPEEYFAERPEGVHGVFEDALPDDWGRALLAKKAKLSRAEQTIPKLLEAIGANGLGALSFSSDKALPVEDTSAGMQDIEAITEAAMKYDAGLPVDDDYLGVLLSCGSSPGGARPKALVKDNDGTHWIAKFPKLNDNYHVEPIEAATLHLAGNAGIQVPDFILQNAGKRQALLIKRFDLSARGGRNHMISMQTLLGADGYYHLSYSNMFSVLRQHSTRPEKDTERLYRQMIFNSAIGNTDDHLKNFTMLHNERGFSLSPAYDLLPDIHENREHRLSFPQGGGTLPPGRKILKRIGILYKVPNPDRIIGEVLQSMAGWKDMFQKYCAPKDEILRIGKSIAPRLERLA